MAVTVRFSEFQATSQAATVQYHYSPGDEAVKMVEEMEVDVDSIVDVSRSGSGFNQLASLVW